MSREYTRLVGLLSRLRWAIPMVVSLVSAGYILLEQVVLQGHALSTPHVVRTLLLFGIIGPVLSWLALTWGMKAALAEAEARQELAFRNRELAALNAIVEAASQSLDLEGILQTALERMVKLIGLEAAEMWLVEGERLILKAHYGVSSDFVTREMAVQFGHCLCGTCAQTGEVCAIDSLAAEISLVNSPCAREGFQSTFSVPMKTDGRVVGVIHVASRQRSAFAPRDQQILTAIARQIATIIKDAQLYEKASRRAMHLETAGLVGQRVTALLDLNSLLAEVVTLIREKFGYYQAHILLVDEEVRELVLKEASGPGAELIRARGLRLKIGQEGITGWVAHTGQALLCNDVSQEPRYHEEELLPETRAELAVPLCVKEQVIGVLDVQSDRYGTFDEEDVTALQILGNQVAAAIENARLFQETKHRYEAMIALHETSLDMISQLDTTELLEALLSRGTHLLGAQAGSLWRYDATEELIYNVANYNTCQDWMDVIVPLGKGLTGRVILTGEPLIVNDYKNWPGRSEAFASTTQTRLVGVPLKWRDQTIGGIVIVSDAQARPFDQNDAWLLSLFADLATIAIKNTELHMKVKEFSQELERRVEERTRELTRAKEDIIAKAEQLRSLLAKTIRIQEEERARIARDMHDGVIQLITAARYELQAVKVAVGSGSAAATQEKLNAVREVLEEIEKEIRHVIYDLHPPILDAVGLVPVLQNHASNFQVVSGINCDVQVQGDPYRLPSPAEVAVFRMVEEALHNVGAHARARTASVILDYRPAMFCVTVQDDGHGFDYQRWTESHDDKHLGLLGMQERVETLGGEMEVWSEPGRGTRVMCRLPLQRNIS